MRHAGGDRAAEARRKAIFRLLVLGHDHAMSVAESRAMVRDRFGVSDDAVRRIEREGIAGGWPPL